jgi:hypothetical protein
MKSLRRSVLSVCGLALVFAAGFIVRGFVAASPELVSSAQAQEGRKCSARTLKGNYGIKFEGRKVDGTPLTSVSLIRFDGNGQFTTEEIGRFNGEPVQRTFTGPYTVNDDCTGFLDFTSGLTNPPHEVHGNFVIVSEGREFFVLDNEEGWAANGVGKKL